MPRSGGAPRRERRLRWPLAIGGIVVFGLGVLVGRQTTPAVGMVAANRPAGAPAAPARRPPAFIPRSGPPSFKNPASTAPAPDSTPATPAQRADRVVSSLFRRLSLLPPTEAHETTEGRANAVKEFTLGMVEAMVQEGPEIREALSQEYTARLCQHKGNLLDEQVLALANLGQAFPQITSASGFDCFFSRNVGQETLPVWAMLDAWRHSGHEKNAAIRQLEASARDVRTRQRFLSHADELRARAGSDPVPTR
jgi:hypothetical protein